MSEDRDNDQSARGWRDRLLVEFVGSLGDDVQITRRTLYLSIIALVISTLLSVIALLLSYQENVINQNSLLLNEESLRADIHFDEHAREEVHLSSSVTDADYLPRVQSLWPSKEEICMRADGSIHFYYESLAELNVVNSGHRAGTIVEVYSQDSSYLMPRIPHSFNVDTIRHRGELYSWMGISSDTEVPTWLTDAIDNNFIIGSAPFDIPVGAHRILLRYDFSTVFPPDYDFLNAEFDPAARIIFYTDTESFVAWLSSRRVTSAYLGIIRQLDNGEQNLEACLPR